MRFLYESFTGLFVKRCLKKRELWDGLRDFMASPVVSLTCTDRFTTELLKDIEI